MKRKNTILGVSTALLLAIPIGYFSINTDENLDNSTNGKTNKRSNTFLVISDTHLHNELTQDEIYHQGNEADTGYDLWDIAVPKFKSIIEGTSKHPKPDYVILLGDLPWHAYPTSTTNLESARKNTGLVLSELREAAENANIPLIYAPGNNDSWSGDYRAFTSPNGETPYDQDKEGASQWPVINSGTCDTEGTQACLADNNEGNLGCYAVYPLGEKGGIRLVIMNSVMFKEAGDDKHRLHYYGKPREQAKDIKAQMDWFKKQFTEGNAKDAIMIGFHIPPGLDGHSKSAMWNTDITYDGMPIKDAFLKIISDNKDRIVGVLSSHTHLDGLRKMMYKDKNDSLQFSDLIVSIPAITPRNGNNPAMKLFSYDPNNNHEWMNFTTINHQYWPLRTVGTTWNEGPKVSFNKDFKGDTLVPIEQRVAKMDSLTLLKAVTKIYKAGGNPASISDVAITIEVKPDN